MALGFRKNKKKAEFVDDTAADGGQITDDQTQADAGASNTEDSDVDAPKKEKSTKKRGKRERQRRKDEMLSSVLTESEPGAAVDVMRKVSNFVIPHEIIPTGGYVVMVLPTADKSFGGLSKRQNKDEDKGLIINLMQAGDIEIVITEDLLDDDALAIIPDEKTLERLDEFSIMRDARYMWGIAVTDIDTGDLLIYTVPPHREKDAEGKLYETAAAISRGDVDLFEVINSSVVSTVWSIFVENEVGYGKNGVMEAIDLMMEVYGVRRGEGRMPATEDYTNVLYHHFPLIDPDYDPQAVVEPEDDDDMSQDAVPAKGVYDNDGASAAGDAPTDTVKDSHDNDTDSETTEDSTHTTDAEHAPDHEVSRSVNAGDNGDGDRGDGGSDDLADVDDGAPSDVESAHDDQHGDDQRDDDQHQGVGVASYTEEYDDNAPVSSADTVQSQHSAEQIDYQQLVQAIHAAVPQQVTAQLSDEDMDRLAQRQMQFLQSIGAFDAMGPKGVQSRMIEQLNAQSQAEEANLDQQVRSNFIDDDLGLALDTTLFDNTFYGQLPQLTFSPYDSQTPWLNEQLAEIVRAENSLLEANYMRRREVIRDKYEKMLMSAIGDANERVSVDDPASPYYDLRKAAENDREQMRHTAEHRASTRRQELHSTYDNNRRAYVESRMHELGLEFDRENRSDLDYNIRMVESDINAVDERVYDSMISEINRKRSQEAQSRYKLSQYEIMHMLNSELLAVQEGDAQDIQRAVDKVNTYLNNKAEDDIMHDNVLIERMKRDNRIEEIRRDAEDQIAAARERADAEIARNQESMYAMREEHARFVEDLNKDNAIRLENAQHQIDAVNSERERDREHLKSMEQRLHEEFEAKTLAADDRVAQAEANMEAFVKTQKSDHTTMIISSIVLSIVMFVAGIASAGALF